MSLNQIDVSIKNSLKPRLESSTEQNTSKQPSCSCKMPTPVLMRFFKPAKGEKKFWKAKRNASSNVQTLLKRNRNKFQTFSRDVFENHDRFFFFVSFDLLIACLQSSGWASSLCKLCRCSIAPKLPRLAELALQIFTWLTPKPPKKHVTHVMYRETSKPQNLAKKCEFTFSSPFPVSRLSTKRDLRFNKKLLGLGKSGDNVAGIWPRYHCSDGKKHFIC